MKHDSILFDLDGTLWDSRQAVADARNRTVKKMGLNLPMFTAEDIQKTMGMTRDQIYEVTFKGLVSREEYEALRAAMDPELSAIVAAGGATLYAGVRETLEVLSRTHPLFLVSNCGINYLKNFFAWSGLRPLFRDTLCYGDTGRPKAENIRTVVGMHRLDRPVYVGDTALDQRSAAAAQVPYVHADYGFGEPEEECVRIAEFSALLHIAR